jgi:hypothetical protein
LEAVLGLLPGCLVYFAARLGEDDFHCVDHGPQIVAGRAGGVHQFAGQLAGPFKRGVFGFDVPPVQTMRPIRQPPREAGFIVCCQFFFRSSMGGGASFSFLMAC